jgi:PAS domain-containing protein
VSGQKSTIHISPNPTTELPAPGIPLNDLNSDTEQNQSKQEPRWSIRSCYVRQAGAWWCATNLIAAFSCAIIAWGTISSTVTVAWLLFTALNAILYMKISSGSVAWLSSNGSDDISTQGALAIAFGFIWGTMVLGSTPDLSVTQALVVVGITLMIAIAGLLVFAPHLGAYPAFLIPLAIISAFGLEQNAAITHGALGVAVAAVFLFGLSAIYAKFIRTTMNAATSMASLCGIQFESTHAGIGLFLDIQYRALKQLIRDRRRSIATLDAIGEAIITTSEVGLVDYMNPVAEVLTGVESGQAHGNHIDGIVKLIGRDDSLSVSSIIELCHLEGRVKSNGQRVSL